MKKVLVMVPCRENHKKMLEEAGQGQCEFSFVSEEESDAVKQAAVEQANIIIGEPRKRYLQNVPDLEWVQMTWAGTDVYTQKPGFPRRVKLTNMTGAFGGVIAEYAFSGILALYRHLPTYGKQQRQHLWQEAAPERTIEGKRALILGAGDIGENMARRLKAFGAYVVGTRRVVRQKPDCFDEMVTLDALDEQLPQADIVMGCLPNTPATTGLFDRERLLRMKKDAVLVNVGRGSLIVTDDLAAVMAQGHLYGAVIDVTEPEPLPEDHPLWDLENVILTPHMAGPSFNGCAETDDKIYAICCENLKRYLAGQPLRNEVNWETGYRKVQ
jgi:phosphoglycerate dehydrogenase-like enzyme